MSSYTIGKDNSYLLKDFAIHRINNIISLIKLFIKIYLNSKITEKCGIKEKFVCVWSFKIILVMSSYMSTCLRVSKIHWNIFQEFFCKCTSFTKDTVLRNNTLIKIWYLPWKNPSSKTLRREYTNSWNAILFTIKTGLRNIINLNLSERVSYLNCNG